MQHRKRLKAAGIALVSLLSVSCGEAPTAAPAPEVPSIETVQGRVTAVGGGDVAGLLVLWRARGAAAGDSAVVATDGTFELTPSTEDPAGELLIDEPGPRRFHPFLYPLHRDSMGIAEVLLIPRRWTVDAGAFAGQTVEIPLDPVLDDDVARLAFTYFFGQGDPAAEPTRYLLDLKAWPSDGLPIRVAFDRQNGVHPVSETDSAAIWSVLDRMETVFGIDLFRPVPADPAWWDAPWFDDPTHVPGVIRVVLEPGSWGAIPLPNRPHAAWNQDLAGWATGRFEAFRVQHTDLNGGVLLAGGFDSLRLEDGLIPWETVLIHEMLHVLGVGHTCRLPSPQGPCLRTPEPSAEDVAYVQLLRETLRLAREEITFLGIMPAAIGERRVLLDLPALPALSGDP